MYLSEERREVVLIITIIYYNLFASFQRRFASSGYFAAKLIQTSVNQHFGDVAVKEVCMEKVGVGAR